MYFFYCLGIYLLEFVCFLICPINKKINKMVKGQKQCFNVLKNIKKEDNIAWFHCSSLGEFEQARNLIENFKQNYPNLKYHLDRFKDVITTDNKPYGIHRARNEYFFKGEKILSLRKCVNRPLFSYVDFDSYVNQAYYVIKSNRINLKYLTALLNSNLIAFWLKYKGKMQGNNFQVDKEPLLNIPILYIENNPLILNEINTIVDKIIFLKVNEITDNKNYLIELEEKLNKIFYKLYDLSNDDIEFIRGEKFEYP